MLLAQATLKRRARVHCKSDSLIHQPFQCILLHRTESQELLMDAHGPISGTRASLPEKVRETAFKNACELCQALDAGGGDTALNVRE